MIMLASAAGLVAISILMIYASGNPYDFSASLGGVNDIWKKQAIFAAGGFIGLIFINSFNYKKLGSMSGWLYIGIVIVLALLLLDAFIDIPFVPLKKGSRRWITFGSFLQIQPSEFFKLIYIIALGWHLRYRSNYRNLSSLLPPFILTIIPIGLIFLEPDLGTTLLMMPVFLSMLFLAGAKVKHIVLIISVAILAAPILWLNMHDYQRMRVSSVLLQNNLDGSDNWLKQQSSKRPWLAKLLGVSSERLRTWEAGEGYQLTRSKLAIASGGLSGQGYRNGPFVKYYKFLPEKHNDFIFAFISHQWGFAGALLVIGLYALLIACGLEIAAASTDMFGGFVAAGISIIFAIQVIVNIGMNIGLMPITGITLPLVSYGGSSLVANILAVGLVNNIGRSK
ncbi:MAG: FtsW/RodA/SpoVE family cell cycle protein [Phycisphaerales bacterium]